MHPSLTHFHSGADLQALCASAVLHAAKRHQPSLTQQTAAAAGPPPTARTLLMHTPSPAAAAQLNAEPGLTGTDGGDGRGAEAPAGVSEAELAAVLASPHAGPSEAQAVSGGRQHVPGHNQQQVPSHSPPRSTFLSELCSFATRLAQPQQAGVRQGAPMSRQQLPPDAQHNDPQGSQPNGTADDGAAETTGSGEAALPPTLPSPFSAPALQNAGPDPPLLPCTTPPHPHNTHAAAHADAEQQQHSARAWVSEVCVREEDWWAALDGAAPPSSTRGALASVTRQTVRCVRVGAWLCCVFYVQGVTLSVLLSHD